MFTFFTCSHCSLSVALTFHFGYWTQGRRTQGCYFPKRVDTSHMTRFNMDTRAEPNTVLKDELDINL